MLKKLKYTILVFALFVLIPAYAFAAGAPAGVLDARQGVAQVYSEYYDYGIVGGSGFAIGDGGSVDFIVTNYHVVEGEPDVITVVTDTNLQTKARVYAELPASDLAILQLNKPINDLTPLQINTDDMEQNIGKVVYALGFPGAADIMFDEADHFTEQVSITSGIVSSVKPISFFSSSGKTVRTYQIDVPLSGGNSGGPLLNERGEVIGVNSFGLSGEGRIYADAENINGAISTLELKQLLDEYGIEYLQGNLFPVWIWIVVAAAAAIIIVLLIIRKKRSVRTMGKRAQQNGMTLKQYLGAIHTAISFDEVLRLLSPAAYQLAQMHAQMRIYGNVSPDTLIINPDTGQAQLADLSGVNIGTGNMMVSPGFSPLEKYRQDLPKTPATDVYGFCAVLYYVLFRVSPPEIFARMQNDQVVAGNVGTLSILGQFKQGLLKGLHPDPGARFRDAGEMVSALSIAPPAMQAASAQSMQANANAAPRKKKKLLWLIPVGIVAAVAIVAGVLISNNNNTLKAAELLMEQERYAQAVQKFDSAYFMPASYQGEYTLAQAGAAMQDENYDKALSYLDGMDGDARADEMRKDVVLIYSERLYMDDKAEEGLALLEPYMDDEDVQETVAYITVGEADWLFQNDDFEGGYEWMARVPDTEVAQKELKMLVEDWTYILAYEYYDLDQAIELLEHVPDQEADYVKELKEEVVTEKALFLIEMGEYEEAVELLSLVGDSAEYVEITRFLQAIDLVDRGDLGEARILLNELRTGDEFSGPAREVLAEISSSEYLEPLLYGEWEGEDGAQELYLYIDEDIYESTLPESYLSTYLYFVDEGFVFTDEQDNEMSRYEVWHVSYYDLVLKDGAGNYYDLEAVF